MPEKLFERGHFFKRQAQRNQVPPVAGAEAQPDFRCIECGDLFEVERGPAVMVVTFIAMLELARERLLELTQAEAFAPIYVRLAYTPS